jgi:hypothetical protein
MVDRENFGEEIGGFDGARDKDKTEHRNMFWLINYLSSNRYASRSTWTSSV